jgi:hypothetical protein
MEKYTRIVDTTKTHSRSKKYQIITSKDIELPKQIKK